MSKSGFTTVLLTAFFLSASGAARAQSIDNFGKFFIDGGGIYGSAGLVIMHRSTPGGGAIIASNPGGAPFLSANAYQFDWSRGFDGTIGVRFLHTEAIEARILTFHTSTGLNFTSPGSFIGVGFTGPTNTAFASNYDTKLSSWEVNWRHRVFDQLSVLAGVRSFTLKDDLFTTINTTVAAGDYSYDNKLFGAQIGADVALLPLASPLQVNVFGKIGRYTLTSSGGITEFQPVGNAIGGFGTSISDKVYVSEAGVSAGYRVTNNILIRGAYQALWFNNLGLASENASASLFNPSLLNGTVYRGNVSFQGFNFGATITW